ncbi:uncharacterized protein LOC143465358 [Clavelina lepadiformis]|uniref:uncharacterized protein LOC143465358 n=1 Tax=Clavelina lepadiformis TaxID=159417 RepID=UPI004043663A
MDSLKDADIFSLASSSCLTEKDIFICGFGQNDFTNKIKTALEKSARCSVSTDNSPVPAGREFMLNMQSLIKHAKFKVFLVTSKIAEYPGQLYQYLNLQSCLSSNTLVMDMTYDEMLSSRKFSLKNVFPNSCIVKHMPGASSDQISVTIRNFYQQNLFSDIPKTSPRHEANVSVAPEDDTESFHTAFDDCTGASRSCISTPIFFTEEDLTPVNEAQDCPVEDLGFFPIETWQHVKVKKKHTSSPIKTQGTVSVPTTIKKGDLYVSELTETISGAKGDCCMICYSIPPYDNTDTGSYKFTQDVVSLWNVPKRGKAYICIGAEYKNNSWKCSGYITTKREWDFRNMFQKKYFNYTPSFHLENISILDNDIAIIVIHEPQASCTEPCSAVDSGPEGLWDQYDVYVRQNYKNVTADEKLQKHIFNWFQKPTKLSAAALDQIESYCAQIDKFYDLVYKFDPKRDFFLVLGPVQSGDTYLESMANIPWRRVFDFDPKTRTCGVLRYIEEHVRAQRFLSVSDVQDKPAPLSKDSTDWVQINSMSDNNPLSAAEAQQWFKKNQKHVKGHIRLVLGHNKPPLLIVLWHEEQSLVHMIKFLQIVVYEMNESGDLMPIVICLPSWPSEGSRLFYFLEENSMEEKVVILSLENVCTALQSITPITTLMLSEISLLPLYKGMGEVRTVSISKADMAWLKVHLDVLSLSDSDAYKQHLQNVGHKLGEEFLKGGQITWEEIFIGAYHAERSIHYDAVKHIKQVILCGKSCVVNIYHTPGGGGTTFARHLLWDLRECAPCVYLSSAMFPIQEVKERVAFLSENTFLPVVLLIDGRSANKVKTLLDQIHYEKLIILHVQRYNLTIEKSDCKENRIYLTDQITTKEAVHLNNIFKSVSETSNKDDIQNLTHEIVNNEKHRMFEYGILSFQDEFIGLASYVEGYLQLAVDHNIDNLADWQKIVAFVSLAYFYGHCHIPAQFFQNILGCEDVVSIENLPNTAQRFIHEDPNHLWKISYNVVAKQILEHILGTQKNNDAVQLGLSRVAKTKLHLLALSFLETVRTRNFNHKYSTRNILDTLTSVFLKRNYKYMDANDVLGESKPRFSRLLEDLVDDKHRLQILKTLVEIFPEEHYFHAHLGRFYSFLAEFNEAEKELQMALDILHERHEVTPNSQRLKKNLSLTHTMFGFCYVKKLEHMLGSRMGYYKPKQNHKETTFQNNILAITSAGITHFEESRTFCRSGNRTYGYIGEIKLRLLVIEFLQKIYGEKWQSYTFQDEEEDNAPSFVQKCLPVCDTLLTECAHVTPQLELNKLCIYYECVNLFTAFFHTPDEALQKWQGRNSTLSRRNQISVIKIKHHKASRHSSKTMIHIDHVKDSDDLKKIVNLYHQSIRHELLHQTPNIRISGDMLEWLYGIRLHLISEDYKLADVLQLVTQWDQRNERDSLSTYYRYVLCTVLAITLPGKKLCAIYAKQSSEERKRLMSCKSHLPDKLSKINREWLSNYDIPSSFRTIVNHLQLGEWGYHERIWKDPAKICQLRPCTGAVVQSAHPYEGKIQLDVKVQHQILVFFVPKNYSLYGKRFGSERKRVEFYIGFSPEHGATAFSVQILLNGTCQICSIPVEIRKLGDRRLNVCPKCNNIVYSPKV